MVLIQFVLGMSGVLYKLALPALNPLTLCLVREVGASSLLLTTWALVTYWKWRKKARYARQARERLSPAARQQLLAAEGKQTQTGQRQDGKMADELQLHLDTHDTRANPLTTMPAYDHELEEARNIKEQMLEYQEDEDNLFSEGVLPSFHKWSCASFSRLLSPLFIAGCAMWLGQVAMVLGCKLYGPAGGVVASGWQPSQPIWTLLLAAFVFNGTRFDDGAERRLLFRTGPGRNGRPGKVRVAWRRVSGVMLGCAGAVAMVILGQDGGDDHSKMREDQAAPEPRPLLASLLFFLNCIGSSAYVIYSKRLIKGEAAISNEDARKGRTPPPKLTPLATVALSYTVTAAITVVLSSWINEAPVSDRAKAMLKLEHIKEQTQAVSAHSHTAQLDVADDPSFRSFLLRTLCADNTRCIAHPWSFPREPSTRVEVDAESGARRTVQTGGDHVPLRLYVTVIWIVVVQSCLLLVLQGWAVRHIPSSSASFHTVEQPVFGMAITWVLVDPLRLNPVIQAYPDRWNPWDPDSPGNRVLKLPNPLFLVGVAVMAAGILLLASDNFRKRRGVGLRGLGHGELGSVTRSRSKKSKREEDDMTAGRDDGGARPYPVEFELADRGCGG